MNTDDYKELEKVTIEDLEEAKLYTIKDETPFTTPAPSFRDIPVTETEMFPVIVKTVNKRKNRSFGKTAAALLLTVAIGGTSVGFGIGLGLNAFNDKTTANETAEIQLTQDELTALIKSQMSDAQYIPTTTTTDTNANSALSSVSSIFKKVKDSVVSINMTTQITDYFNRTTEQSGAGSGIIFSEDLTKIYIVTNYHVIDSANKVTISIDDKNEVSANYVGGDSKADIAIISVNKSDLENAGITNYTIASFGDSDKIEVGDAVIAIGNAYGEGKSATFGIISTEQKTISIDGTTLDVIQTDAAINPGNSGGALVNGYGEIIGVNTAKLSSTGVEGMGYAIPINIVKSLTDQIIENGSIERPYLGLSAMIEITEEVKEYYGLPSVGIYVKSVVSNSTAAKAGLKREDIITEINGKTIRTEQDYNDAISSIKVGSEVSITVVRTTITGINMFGSATGRTSETIVLTGTMQNYVSELNF